MKNYTRIFAMLMAIVMVLGLTACGGSAKPDTTEAPETTAAPVTEAPVDPCADGHTWEDATCAAPKTCSVCGETEGEPLEHTWIDATYDAPKTCEVCGATEGEALVPDFVAHGLSEKICDRDKEYDLSTACLKPDDKNTVGKITVTDYQIIESDETHEAMDGYEWRILTLNMHFDDENVIYGVSGWDEIWSDFYKETPKNSDTDKTGLHEDGMVYTITWNDTEYPDGRLRIDTSNDGWQQYENGNYYIDFTNIVSVRVPVGYDGFVYGLEHWFFEMPDDAYLYDCATDNTLLFRFD